jgi:hypothetical protein
MDSTLTTIVGIFLRIGIPAVITIAAGWMLYRLDVRWQEETRKEAAVQGKPVMAANFGCWDINGCSEAGKKKCPAYIHKDEMPCWQVFRSSNGELKESCLNCKVLKQAPVPVRA